MGLILPGTQKTGISDERWWWEAMAAEECLGSSCGWRPSGRRAREEVGECEDDFCWYHATPCVYASITSSSGGRIYGMARARPARGYLSRGGGVRWRQANLGRRRADGNRPVEGAWGTRRRRRWRWRRPGTAAREGTWRWPGLMERGETRGLRRRDIGEVGAGRRNCTAQPKRFFPIRGGNGCNYE